MVICFPNAIIIPNQDVGLILRIFNHLLVEELPFSSTYSGNESFMFCLHTGEVYKKIVEKFELQKWEIRFGADY